MAKKKQVSNIRVAVISDLHVYDGVSTEPAAPSWLSTATPKDKRTEHPVAALKQLVEEESLKADLVLCPGDLGDKANTAGIKYGWQIVHDVAEMLGAKRVYGTAGNHDIDSRFTTNKCDPLGFLSTLSPPFPTPCSTQNDCFWSKQFVIEELTDIGIRLAIINSSAFHGYRDEKEHGRITELCLARLEATLNALPRCLINIALIHHHPHKFADMPFAEQFDEILGGSNLIQLLGKSELGDWLIVHGHKHYPGVIYGPGSDSPPIIFAAGSFSAKLAGPQSTVTRNQFYLLEFNKADINNHGLVGTFRSWSWNYGGGWHTPDGSDKLPPSGGFGVRGTASQLATNVAKWLSKKQKKQLPLLVEQMTNELHDWKYSLPDTRAGACEELKRHHSVEVTPSKWNPQRIGYSDL